MAKTQILKVTKELKNQGIEVSNKEVIEFLNSKGVEVSSHMNSISDDEVAMVYGRFGGKRDSSEGEKKEDRPKDSAPKTVAAGEENNGVLPCPVHLNHGVAVGGFGPAQEGAVHAAVLQPGPQHFPLGPHQPGVVDLRPSHSQSYGLVQPLAAAAEAVGDSGDGLTGLCQVVHGVDVVDVQRANIQNLHFSVLSMLRAWQGVTGA